MSRLGILGIEIGPGLRDRLPTPRMPGGVLVAARAADAPAGDQMPLPGDIITAINGTPIARMPDLREALAAVSPRSPCVLQVQRGDRLMFLVLDLD